MKALSMLVVATIALLTVATSDAQGPSAGAQPADAWEITCVECPKWIDNLTDRSLRLDSNDLPHIVYGGDHLYYAFFDGAAWIHETVDHSDEVGWSASLGLGSDGQPHIAYYDLHMERLLYATREGETWRIETVDTQFAAGRTAFMSLALDQDNQPHVAYENDLGLTYATRQAATGTWQAETVDTSAGACISLALDPTGLPHIGYGDSILHHAVRSPTGWLTETVDSHAGGACSLAIDSAGQPHISYSRYYIELGLAYAHVDAGGWHAELLTDTRPSHTSLALDSSDLPHISFALETNLANLQYAYRDQGDWRIETIEQNDVGRWSYESSVAVDSDGLAHIVYHAPGTYRVLDKRLVYARSSGTDWQIETVDNAAAAGIAVSLAFDSSAYPHLSYLGGGLKHAYLTTSGWHVDTLDALGGEASSLMLDGTDQAHVAYSAYYPCDFGFEPVELKVGNSTASGWQAKIVDRPPGLHQQIPLAILPDGRPAVAYIGGGLAYAYQDNAGWHIDRVDRYCSYDCHPSLVVGSDGVPRIAYARNGLAYATRSTSGWHSEIVTDQIDTRDSIVLAIDDSNIAHIAYFYAGTLMHAYQNPDGWHTETVDATGSMGLGLSLALDASGMLHIAYYDTTNRDLRYAYWNSEGWVTEVIDSNGDVGQYASIALDDDDRVCIGYYDATLADLKLACQERTS